MPWKNPRCPKCGARTKQGKILDEDKCYYVCRDKERCGHKFIDWRHKKPTYRDNLKRLRMDREMRRRRQQK